MAKRSSSNRSLIAVLAVYALFLVLQFFPPNIPFLKEIVGQRIYLHLLIALLSVIACLIGGGTLSRDLMLRSFRFRHVPAALFLWASAAILMELILDLLCRILPGLSAAGSTATGALLGEGLLSAILLYALLPAVCEELLFRGYMLSTLRRSFSVGMSSLLCGALFAVAHTVPVRMVPMLLLGFFLSLAGCYSGSVFIPMLMHFINNLCVVLSANYPAEAAAVRGFVFGWGDFAALLMAVAAGFMGIILLRGKPGFKR
ncbi:MAG: CPBP family intramembrane metalloprotease [Clostridia bacterium]|nr:CPBP family intramembrane metalloprotease [Clostridia bacterium]